MILTLTLTQITYVVVLLLTVLVCNESPDTWTLFKWVHIKELKKRYQRITNNISWKYIQQFDFIKYKGYHDILYECYDDIL